MINNYIVILLAILVLIILVILYLFNKQLTSLRVKINSLTYELDKQNNTQDVDILSNLVNENCNELFDEDGIEQSMEDEFNNGEEDSDEEDDDGDDDGEEEDDDEESCEEDDDDDEVDEVDEVEELSEDEDEGKILIDESINNNLEEVVENIEISMKNDGNFSVSKKKVPNTPAKELDVDTVMKSENDNNDYIVTSDKNGRKRWKKM